MLNHGLLSNILYNITVYYITFVCTLFWKNEGKYLVVWGNWPQNVEDKRTNFSSFSFFRIYSVSLLALDARPVARLGVTKRTSACMHREIIKLNARLVVSHAVKPEVLLPFRPGSSGNIVLFVPSEKWRVDTMVTWGRNTAFLIMSQMYTTMQGSL